MSLFKDYVHFTCLLNGYIPTYLLEYIFEFWNLNTKPEKYKFLKP